MRGKKIVFLLALCSVMSCTAGCGKADKAYKQAMKYAESGKYDKAVDSFKTAIKENGDKAEYFIDYGMTLNHLGEYKSAIKQFEKAYQNVDNKISRQNNKRLHYGEALAYYGLHQYDKAKEQCNMALEVTEYKELNGDVYATLAMSQFSSGDSLGALGVMDQMLKENKKDVQGYVLRGQIKQSIGEYDSSANDFLQAIDLDDKCYDAYFGCYETYIQSGQTDAATETLNKLTSMHGANAQDKMQIGRAYICLEKTDEAKDILLESQKGNCAEANFYLGKIEQSAGAFEQAKDYYETYLEECKSEVTIPQVYGELAGCYMEIKDYEKAEKYLEQGLAMGVTAAYQELLRNQVILLERMGNMKEAQKKAKEYMEAYPQDADMAKEAEFIATRVTKK
ncbi:MAG: tetratricopeptide repeat protein [Lachnospiraceae bacterium]|nr:tetratricopeptide repeat protein [Lachnospiraceae bacterium]